MSEKQRRLHIISMIIVFISIFLRFRGKNFLGHVLYIVFLGVRILIIYSTLNEFKGEINPLEILEMGFESYEDAFYYIYKHLFTSLIIFIIAMFIFLFMDFMSVYNG